VAESPSADPRFNGWRVLYHPVFRTRYIALRDEVRGLKQQLSPERYAKHPRVKLFAAVRYLITERVPADPNAEEFRLRKELSKHRRAKGQGLPPRYRLFWVFSESARVIIFTYLNDEATLRKAGGATDPYEIYKKMVDRGDIGQNFEHAYRQWQQVLGAAAAGSPASNGGGILSRPRRRPKKR